MKELSKDYMAGLFDGEGWFSISRAKGSHYRSTREWAYQVHAAMTLREKVIVDHFCYRFGGTVNKMKSRSEKHSDYWHWRITGKNVADFATGMMGHLHMKRDQAIVAASFQREKGLQGNQPISDERYQLYQDYYEQMKSLNAKGVGK